MIGAASVVGVAAAGGRGSVTAPRGGGLSDTSVIRPGDTILFQGDSITDGGRVREAPGKVNSHPHLGSGYAWLAAASLLVDYPDAELKVINRGISGNKVFQLNDRWKVDCVDLQPNVLSILIGINDYWHHKKGTYPGTLETYATDYRALLERTRRELPDVRLVICEPFLTVSGEVDPSWLSEFAKYSEVARRLAEDFRATYVPFHDVFQRASAVAPAELWAPDGVHPSADGAALMAHAWLRAVVA